MNDRLSLDLFANAPEQPGGLGCAIEIAATMAEALDLARERGLSRAVVAHSMSFHLGEKVSEATLNGYTAQSHGEREPSLRRAMAFDAALGDDVLLGLYARKRGGRRVVTAEEAAYIELGRIQQKEKALAERKRALQTLLKAGKA
ncbi:MAG: hypothetical protein Q7U97_05560 [Rhodocyclaceae bacterium]|nr:hypothetical protein [Rhodocyclaceae bacterium]